MHLKLSALFHLCLQVGNIKSYIISHYIIALQVYGLAVTFQCTHSLLFLYYNLENEKLTQHNGARLGFIILPPSSQTDIPSRSKILKLPSDSLVPRIFLIFSLSNYFQSKLKFSLNSFHPFAFLLECHPRNPSKHQINNNIERERQLILGIMQFQDKISLGFLFFRLIYDDVFLSQNQRRKLCVTCNNRINLLLANYTKKIRAGLPQLIITIMKAKQN